RTAPSARQAANPDQRQTGGSTNTWAALARASRNPADGALRAQRRPACAKSQCVPFVRGGLQQVFSWRTGNMAKGKHDSKGAWLKGTRANERRQSDHRYCVMAGSAANLFAALRAR